MVFLVEFLSVTHFWFQQYTICTIQFFFISFSSTRDITSIFCIFVIETIIFFSRTILFCSYFLVGWFGFILDLDFVDCTQFKFTHLIYLYIWRDSLPYICEIPNHGSISIHQYADNAQINQITSSMQYIHALNSLSMYASE